MARSPQGRSAAGEEAARTLSEAASAGSGSGGSPGAPSKSGAGASPASASASKTPVEPATVSLPEVAYGKVLNVPDNLLGAGYTGKGWTIDEAVMEGGKPVIKLHRRVGNTGRIEKHKIDGETFARAKAYREKQAGMAKSFKPLALKKEELGHPLDPQREVTPYEYDAGTGSWLVGLPGGRQPQWIKDDVIREVKQGRPGAVERLRKAAGLQADASTPGTAATVGQAVASVVGTAILGKTIANSFGLGNKNKEKAPDRPSTSGSPPQSAPAQTREANRAANNQPEDRAAQEQQARNQHLRRLSRERAREEADEGDATTQAAPDRGAVTYNVTNKPGESSKVEVDAAKSGEQAFSTTTGTTKPRSAGGTRLTIDETTDAQAPEITNKDSETEQTNVSDTSQNPQASYQTINRPLSIAIPGAVSSQANQQITSTGGLSQQTSQPDRVQETLQRSEARRQRRQGTREKTTLRGAASLEPNSSSSALGTTAPQPLGKIEITETETSIRQMRELMQAQAQDRNLNITSRLKASVPNSNVGSGFSLPDIASRSSSQPVRGGGISSDVGALASAVAVAGAGAGQLLASAGSRALTLQAARGAVQTIVSMEGTRREEALQRIQSTLEGVNLQIQATSQSLLQTPSSSLGSPASTRSAFTPPIKQSPSREAAGSADAGGQVRVTASSTIPTPQDLSLLQQSASTLRQAQAGVSALPAGAVVPQNFSRNIPGVELLMQVTAPQVSETDSAIDTDTQALQRFASSFSPRQEAASGQSAPAGIETGALASSTPSSPPLSISPDSPSAQAPAIATQGIRVGAPPVPRRRAVSPGVSQGVGPQHVGGRGTLSAPLASAVNLNAAQARDQRTGAQAGGQDARQDALAQDTSVPTETNTSAPIAPLSAGFTSGMSSEQDTEEAEDTLATTGEKAQEMREQSDKTRATGEQFSGAQNPAPGPESHESPTDESQPSPQPSAGLSPGEQLRAGILLGAAQERKQQEEKEAKEKASPNSSSSSKSKGREKSFQERLTKGKLLMDLVEGCFDALGFLEFLAESTLGILNDRYFKLNSLPTLRGIHGGPEDRIDRTLRRGVIFVDIYLFIVVFMAACVVVALIVAIVGGVGGAVRSVIPATP